MNDMRHPNKSTVGTIFEDSCRRDFGINSLYFNLHTSKLLDPSNQGIKDFKERKISFIGSPEKRLTEDMLRAIRAVRFSIKLRNFDFVLDVKQRNSITESYIDSVVSVERIYQELESMFSLICKNDKNINGIVEILHDMKIFNRFIHAEILHKNTISNIFKTLDFFPLAYEYYMSSIEKEKIIMHNLRLSKHYAKWVVLFEEFRKVDISETEHLKDLLERLSGDYEIVQKFCKYYEVYGVDNGYKVARITLKRLLDKARNGEEEPFLTTQLAIGGKDLINKGYKGEQIGLKMKEVLQSVKANPELNNRDSLLSLI